MKITFTILTLILFLFCACKKPKSVIFTGQLLLTKKNPLPLSNRKIEVFQLGGNAIIIGSSGSSATTVTDADGRFKLTFVPGTTYFTAFSGENNSPLSLTGREGYPYFIRSNFSVAGYDANKPIFIGKSIDSLIIKVYCFKSIIPSDTFGLRGNNVNARFEKKYTGIMADSASTLTLDTIYNVLFTNFDCVKRTFSNLDISFGRLKTYAGSAFQSFTGQIQFDMELPAEDETKREMTFYFNN